MAKWTKIVSVVALIAVLAVFLSPRVDLKHCTIRFRQLAAFVLHTTPADSLSWALPAAFDPSGEPLPSRAPADLLQIQCVQLC